MDLLLSQAIEEFLEHLEDKNYAERTLKDYDSELDRFNRWLVKQYNRPVYLSELEEEDLKAHLKHLSNKGNKPTYRNKILYTYKSFFKFIEKKELGQNLAKNLEKSKTRSKEREYLTQEEMDKVLNEIEQHLIWYVTSFLFKTGMRIGACLNLRLDDLDFGNEVIEVRQAKGNKDRKIAMSSKLKEELEEYLEEHRPEVATDYVFANKKTGSLSPRHYNRRLKQAVKRAGIKKKITAHCIRHSTAMALINEDVELPTIQRILSHENLSTTSQYLHSDLSKAREAVESL